MYCFSGEKQTNVLTVMHLQWGSVGLALQVHFCQHVVSFFFSNTDMCKTGIQLKQIEFIIIDIIKQQLPVQSNVLLSFLWTDFHLIICLEVHFCHKILKKGHFFLLILKFQVYISQF